MKRIISVVLIVLLVFPVLSACSSVQATSAPTETVAPPPTDTPVPPTETPVPPTNTPEPTATPIPPTPVPEFREKVDVGGYGLYIACVGEGDMTVILDSGFNGSRTQWAPVMKLNPTDFGVKVCMYDHAGIGSSDRPVNTPRTVEDLAVELHTLLINTGIPGRYVIVGNGGGAFMSRYFVHLYPDEVAGVVMVGSVVPDGPEIILEHIPDPEGEEIPAITDLRKYFSWIWSDEPQGTGQVLFKTSAEMTNAIDSLGDIPLVILWHGVEDRQSQINTWMSFYGGVSEELVIEIEDALTERTKELTSLSSNSTYLVAEGATANILNSKPESIIDAIRIVVDQARKQ